MFRCACWEAHHQHLIGCTVMAYKILALLGCKTHHALSPLY